MKNKIVLQSNQFTSFTSWYLESLWKNYFDIEIYDSTKSYSKNALFVFWWANVSNPLINELLNQGHKVVVDNLWEVPKPDIPGVYQLTNSNWFRWNESLWWTAMRYNQYIPKKTYKKIALMPIRKITKIRDYIVSQLEPWLEKMIWSYKENRLPNDQYIGTDVDQRFVNPQWVNDCSINLVIETKQYNNLFNLTEKSYKPCAYYQPMLILGQTGSLQFLKTQGFETFDNIFDESYDQETNFEKRFDIVKQNLNEIKLEPYSSLTWKKMNHNYNHFYNKQLCEQGITEQIVQPLLDYAET